MQYRVVEETGDETENGVRYLLPIILFLILRRYVFNVFFKVFKTEILRISSGSSFHSLAVNIVNDFHSN